MTQKIPWVWDKRVVQRKFNQQPLDRGEKKTEGKATSQEALLHTGHPVVTPVNRDAAVC